MLIIHISATFNNTIFTITNQKGDTLYWTSAGKQGFKGAKRASIESAESTAQIVGNYLSDILKCREVHIKICGIGVGRTGSLKGLKKSGLSVLSIQDITPIPHNGCRPPKKRRL